MNIRKNITFLVAVLVQSHWLISGHTIAQEIPNQSHQISSQNLATDFQEQDWDNITNEIILANETTNVKLNNSLPDGNYADNAIALEFPFKSSLDGNDSNNSMAQVTPVFQLLDVQSSDWAFLALQRLAERYDCLKGYPDNTFRGNRALTRYEFAAGLNSCLEKLLERNASGQGNLLTQEDLNTLQRLQEDFSTELGTIKNQIDNLEIGTASLEANRFSTTTRLFGNLRVQANTYLSGEGLGGEKPNTTLQYNLYLGFLTSFTGRDLLVTGIGVTDSNFPDLSPTNADKFVGATREGASDTTGSGNTGGDARLITLQYQFPVGEKLVFNLIAANRFRFDPIFLPQFLPYYRLGSGPVSSFAEAPPVYLVGGGGGVSASYEIEDSTVLTLSYIATFANFVDQVAPSIGGGLFNGDYVASAQVNYNPSPGFFLQALYQRGYFQPGNFGFNNGQFFRDNGFIGTALANRFDDAGVFFDDASEVVSDSYLVGGYFALSPKVVIGGWANLFQARLSNKGDATIWAYSVQAAFPDLFKPGNQGGLVVGIEPTLTKLDADAGISCDFCDQFKSDTSLHIEAYYRHQLTERLSVTPSIIWITAPNQDANNQDIVIGGIRTTFNF